MGGFIVGGRGGLYIRGCYIGVLWQHRLFGTFKFTISCRLPPAFPLPCFPSSQNPLVSDFCRHSSLSIFSPQSSVTTRTPRSPLSLLTGPWWLILIRFRQSRWFHFSAFSLLSYKRLNPGTFVFMWLPPSPAPRPTTPRNRMKVLPNAAASK